MLINAMTKSIIIIQQLLRKLLRNSKHTYTIQAYNTYSLYTQLELDTERTQQKGIMKFIS